MNITITLTEAELLYCVKGVGALGMIWNKAAREETKSAREVLRDKLLRARDEQRTMGHKPPVSCIGNEAMPCADCNCIWGAV